MITQRVIDVFAGIGMAALLILAVVIGATLVSEWRLTRRRAYLEERARVRRGELLEWSKWFSEDEPTSRLFAELAEFEYPPIEELRRKYRQRRFDADKQKDSSS